jgi:single-stranded-DNA-specific exonuclease
MQEKNWIFCVPNQVDQIQKNLSVAPLYAHLLGNRGINTKKKAEAFFNPNKNQLHDPMAMEDMDKAVQLIDMHAQDKIRIYGDYDVDGTTSVALLTTFLQGEIEHLDYYIPDREKEGYGLSQKAVNLAIEEKVDLLITIDCGIRSVKLIHQLKDAGIHVIVCDHHLPGEELPPADAILNPKKHTCSYPFDELSGCGIGFKLTQALAGFWGLPEESYLHLTDFVAVSIASDLVPITGENRVLAHLGLEQLKSSPSQGLKMIIDLFIQKRDVDITDLVFMIGPRINAAGRMASAKSAVQLLLAEDESQAEELSQTVNAYNDQRRGLDQAVTSEALEKMAALKNTKTTVVYGDGWHKGVVGIVASRLLEHQYKPTIVLTRQEDYYVGSARSIQAFDVHAALSQCAVHLEQFGGHKYAAGLKLHESNLDAFIQAFEESAERLSEVDLTPRLEYEFELDLAQIDERLYKNVLRFAPFGPGNLRPQFVSRGVLDSGSARTMGKTNDHLKLNLIQKKGQRAIGATAFGFGNLYPAIEDKTFDVLYTVQENRFRGRSSIELMVKDIKFT